MKYLTFLIVNLLIISFLLNEKTFCQTNDTVRQDTNRYFLDNVFANRLFQMTYVSVPLISQGLVLNKRGINFREMRTKNIPQFHNNIDTYTQVLPLVMTYSLKACGVESKDNRQKMIVASSFSTAIGLVTSQIIKHRAAKTRPDNRDNKSFPSGHTTMAFISATILSKEYGEKSYWYSVAGYTVATLTGLSRVANNRHWISDVLAGAGIGILSTETGYFLKDLIFKDKYSNKFFEYKDNGIEKPSFIDMYLTYNHSENKYNLKDNTTMKFKDGAAIGIEGAYFFNKYFGVGSLLDVANYEVVNKNVVQDSTLNVYSANMGAYLSYPIFKRILLGANLSCGLNHIRDNNVINSQTIKEQNHFNLLTAFSLSFWVTEHTFLRFYSNYTISRLNIEDKDNNFKTINVGGSVAFHF